MTVRRLSTAGAALLCLAALAFLAVPRVLDLRGLIVLSGSMEPELHVGDLAFVRPLDPRSVEVGDVITYRATGEAGVQQSHRVVEVLDGPAFRTKGDANEGVDVDVVTADRLVGRVEHAVPFLGHAALWMRDGSNFRLAIWLPVALVTVNELGSIAWHVRHRRRPQPT